MTSAHLAPSVAESADDAPHPPVQHLHKAAEARRHHCDATVADRPAYYTGSVARIDYTGASTALKGASGGPPETPAGRETAPKSGDHGAGADVSTDAWAGPRKEEGWWGPEASSAGRTG